MTNYLPLYNALGRERHEHTEEVSAGRFLAAAEGNATEALGLAVVSIEAHCVLIERELENSRRKNAELVAAAKARAEFGVLATFIILTLCGYTMAVAWMEKVGNVDLNPRGPAILGMSLGCVFALIPLMLFSVRRYSVKAADLGFRLGNWKEAVFGGMLVAAAVFPVLVAFKWLLVGYDPDFYGRPVLNWSAWDPWLLLYGLVAPAQELLTRGFLQNSIERFLDMKHRSAVAICLASAQFGVMHLHYSFRMAVIATVGSLIFGAVFVRQRTLIGVSIAHFILGAMVIGPLQLMLD
jgi:membrane protease YdiL (CAAX protease family)